MSRFKEIAHDQTREDPHWRLFCDGRKRYRLIVEIDEDFTQRDISKLEDSLGAALHDLYRSLDHKFTRSMDHKFVPDDEKK